MAMKEKFFFEGLGFPTLYVRWTGIWDMQDLYETMVDWLRRRKYKFHERIYKHKHPSPFGVERQYTWEARRKQTDYIELVINIYFHTYDAHDVEVVMPNGSKKLYTKGRLWMNFTGKVDFDYEGAWSERAFYKSLKNFFNKYVIKKKLEAMLWDLLWYREIHKLVAVVKERLKMQSMSYEYRYWTGVHR